MKHVVLSREYKVNATKGDYTFSFELVFEEKHFHMQLGDCHTFINNALDVCNQ